MLLKTSRRIVNINYENRIVAFLDILGFRNLINESEKDSSKIISIYQALEYLKTWEKPREWNLNLIEIEEDAQRKEVDSFYIANKTNCTCFSDSIVVSVSIDENNINELVSTLIANLSYIGSYLITEGITIRGGLTIGKLIHNEDGIIMGQALIDAYELENKCSKYPRVILSNSLIQKLNYPLLSKHKRYPYHQYIKRYEDGCVGFSQLSYFQVIQSWENITEDYLKNIFRLIRREIIKGLDISFQSPDIHDKYKWLKTEYNNLIILTDGIKKDILELNENASGHNIHYSYTDDINYPGKG
jgi:hypothetical protein